MSRVISTKIDDKTNEILESIAGELEVSKSWVVQQALKQYLERYNVYAADQRIASIGETISHEKVKEDYGL